MNIFNWFSSESNTACTPVDTDTSATDVAKINDTFAELQSAVRETSLLANDLSLSLNSKLKTTESILATLLCTLADGVAMFTDDGKIKQWNASATAIFGYRKDEVMGKLICDIVNSRIQDFLDKAADGKVTTCFKDEILATHKTGSRLILDISISTLPPEPDTAPCFILIMRDVTEKKKKEKLTKEHEILLNTIITVTDDIVVVKDGNGRWELLNHAAQKVHDIGDQIIGLTSEEIKALLPQHSEELTSVEETDEETWANRTATRTAIIISDQHSKRHYDIIKTPIFDKSGNRDKIITVGRDVTMLKEKRESVIVAHRALNASSDMVCICDNTGNVVFANKRLIEVYHFNSYNDIVGKNMSVVRHPSNDAAFYKNMWSTILAGKIFTAKYYNRDQKGNAIFINASLIPMLSDDTSYFIGIQKVVPKPWPPITT